MRTLVVLALAWCCSAQFAIPYRSIVSTYPWTKYSATDAFGQSTIGHQAFDQTRYETRLADGRVIGQFSYIDSNGEPAITHFEAGPNIGYRVLGSNILPEAPTADLVAPVAPTANLVAPEPVGYTAEVAAARDEHLKAFQKAAAPAAAEEPISREKRSVAVPLPYLHAVPTETKTTVKTQHLTPVDAATPADTAKLELTTKEHVFKVPSIKYVRPVVNIKPYTAPAGVLPYGAFPYNPLAFSGLHYPTLLTPAAKE